MKTRKTTDAWALKSLVIAATLTGMSGVAQASFIDTIDGAVYTLDWSITGSDYKFTFEADFTGYTGTVATDNDYAMAISLASVPGSVEWTIKSLDAAPGDDTKWSIYQGVVANSNGCPLGGSASKDWCIGLNSSDLTGPMIDTSTVLTWVFTMTLSSGTPDFDGDPAWSYKFVTTDGTWYVHPQHDDKDAWNYGNYQISETFSVRTPPDEPPDNPVPVPGTLALLALGLMRLRFHRRSRG